MKCSDLFVALLILHYTEKKNSYTRPASSPLSFDFQEVNFVDLTANINSINSKKIKIVRCSVEFLGARSLLFEEFLQVKATTLISSDFYFTAQEM